MANKKVVCLGDSITASTANRSVPPWPHLLERNLGPGWVVGNSGKPGDNTTMITSRYTQAIQGKGIDYLVVMMGVNDVIPGVALATSMTNINIVVNGCLAEGCKVVLYTVLPVKGYTQWTPTIGANIRILNTNIQAIPPNPNLLIYDTFTDLQDVVTPDQLSYQGGTKPDYVTWVGGVSGDFLHPGVNGCARLAAIAKSSILALG